ncbi:MAG: hypothetical protein DHS20C18_00450 [Saprospiraceae bacterium]|nr:MAG: hypothetical protein DHS20C18_00450 [Saprospiraceae bacterium]
MTGSLGQRLGLQYLFLDPEYLGAVNFLSFYIVGLAYGVFFMSWNLTTYLLTAHHFPFLASLSRPFTKFTLNNLLLPLSFFLFYLILIVYFQRIYEGLPFTVILYNGLGLLSGTLSTLFLYSFYFQFTNRDISYYRRRNRVAPDRTKNLVPGRRNVNLDYIKKDENRWKVRTYLNEALRPRLVRSVAHYEAKLLKNIFRQNHLNALLLQLLSMMLLLMLGYLIDYALFRIPAGASVFIIFSIIAAVVGAVTYWFNEWSFATFILLLVALNYFTSFDFFNRKNLAYGLNYETELAPYSYDKLQKICISDQVETDKHQTINILNKWKKKRTKNENELPKLVVLSVSGGGLKSAAWTMKVVQTADSLLGGKLMDHTMLITGASGGMLGMAYMRELYLQQKLGHDINLYDQQYIHNISKDLLNSIAFTIVSNDLFLPWTKFSVGEHTYHKDRGYIFEQQLNENTDSIFDKPLSAYRQVEEEAIIPLLYLTPSILNDGRRMVISPQGVTFMMLAPVGTIRSNSVEVDAVDFGWLYKQQGADNLKFTTALRMNATYPYVLPVVHLPSTPMLEVVDAGFRDNYGIQTATRFIQVFRKWIEENTSGVVLVQISSSEKIEIIKPDRQTGIIESLMNPLGIAGMVLTTQEFEHDNSLGFIFDLLGPEKFEVIRFLYRSSSEGKLDASVSFHLTNQEREDVLNAIYLPQNQSSLRQLIKILGPAKN